METKNRTFRCKKLFLHSAVFVCRHPQIADLPRVNLFVPIICWRLPSMVFYIARIQVYSEIMLGLNKRAKSALRLVLLFILLAVQTLVLAHQADHVYAEDTSQCAVCSVSDGLDVPVVVSHNSPEAEEHASCAISCQPSIQIDTSYSPSTARAPPQPYL